MPVNNTYKLEFSTPKERIPIESSRRGYSNIRLGSEHGSLIVLFGDETRQQRPLHNDIEVLRAMGAYEGPSPRLIMPPEDWGGIVLRIKARELNFGFAAFAPELNLSPGGEGAPVLAEHCHKGQRQEADQLFSLDNGESLFVADRNSAVAVVTAEDGKAIMRPAEWAEYTLHLHNVGMTARKVRKVGRIFHTLERLGADDPELRAKYAALRNN